MTKLIYKTKEFTVKDYPETSRHVRQYLARYPQYRFEGSSHLHNPDGTMTAICRFYKQVV